ncbi:phage holin family protein [Nocardioides sp.]|jgi:membrane protein|uniref:phage holin family protein n=1 Tax=Nocardioides sp. TaxID=35761 RepID=UPI002F41AE7B
MAWQGSRWHFRNLDVPVDDLVALSRRVAESFAGRCVRRFLGMAGIDRCIVLSSQAFTALIPLLILISTLAPVGKEDVIARSVITRFGLTGDTADAVHQLFSAPEGASSSVGLFSALLLLFSGVSFTRRLQAMYRAAWERPREGARSGLFAALGLLTLLAEVFFLYAVRSVARHLPLDGLVMLLVSAVTGLVLWTSIPYLLLNRRVHWRRLLVAGGLAGAGTAVYGIATAVYMPDLMERYTKEFGLFGITIVLIGWLLIVSGVIVVSAAVGAEFDESNALWAVTLKTRFHLLDPARPPPEADEGALTSGLLRADVVLLVRVAVNWAVLTVGVAVATVIVPGIDIRGGLTGYLAVSLLFGLVNALLGPLLHLVALPLSALTLGVFALVVNGVLLALTAVITQSLHVGDFADAVLGALVISIITTLLEFVLRPLKADR